MDEEIYKAVCLLYKRGLIDSEQAMSLLGDSLKEQPQPEEQKRVKRSYTKRKSVYAVPKIKGLRKAIIDVLQENGGTMKMNEIVAQVTNRIGTGLRGHSHNVFSKRVCAHLTYLGKKGVVSHPKYGSWKLESGFATRSVQEIERARHAASTHVEKGTYSGANYG